MCVERKDSFLESKIQTPTASRNFLVRERLIRRLDEAEERLIIVSAGMGYGKTVLLTHYAKRCPERFAWYHLSGTDNDIMVFARYLSKSVAKAAPEFAPDFSPYLALDQNEALVENLALDFAQLFRELGDREICLVLDDFQVIENQWIFRFLNMILDHEPGGLRLFLCMKSAPPAFCARYLLEGRALVLGADSLAFNVEEVKQLIGEYTAPENLEQVARAVESHMEGWPAGISFAALYFRQRQIQMTEQEIEQACQQSYLQDYFMHELFRKLPFELQHFLTSTAVLDYLRPDVCNALAGIDNAAGQLSYLERENLFILRISGSGHLYRCHGLFRNFLLSQLQPARRRRLLEQASDFYLRTPDKAQAAEYALACGDGVRLQSAVEAAGRAALAQGRLDTLRRWLEGLDALETPPHSRAAAAAGRVLPAHRGSGGRAGAGGGGNPALSRPGGGAVRPGGRAAAGPAPLGDRLRRPEPGGCGGDPPPAQPGSRRPGPPAPPGGAAADVQPAGAGAECPRPGAGLGGYGGERQPGRSGEPAAQPGDGGHRRLCHGGLPQGHPHVCGGARRRGRGHGRPLPPPLPGGERPGGAGPVPDQPRFGGAA